ncbi:dihydrofolate reductase [Anabaena cylindrica FACHB-243]|uniref:Dihydrofolate reductase n=1 Tax=Anabaena cylindrica (strain ATCC 27899 / PCC 7122) TaxID=272123 RepID=K9ZBL4_ANACC|nr:MULTISPECIES: dihydrofolate reductase [Anabaena]AFZ56124.1 dihydrofolate reductase [Anabaena cylindrica PCC 7122]MBD2417355.1 dihydrofolate reductase [Anabaena cylindrica FACHB-243]MBY5282810.1 dihydrofolate reductase [Anabaena sp. CCAP 1446/1C]MBY5310771.1 dihydrofolate reductase [Anabaena sp. CCAP 1446/1C]MCM2404436.1 dihydrofolate reductase [Anabaena sp. CCAP 1446/1C]
MPLISLIAAISENRILADSTKEHIHVGIPWIIPTDERHFQEITWRHPVIMGRRTYSTFYQPLPNRTNIIVTRNLDYQAPGCVIFYSLLEAVEWAKMSETEEIFIAGGGDIYTEAIKFADKLYLTIVEGNFEGDIYFPEFADFGKVTKEEHLQENGFKFKFVEMERV